jgi:signal transduction histidine kinase
MNAPLSSVAASPRSAPVGRGAGGVVVALGATALLGWITGLPNLTRLLPAAVPMAPATATGFLLIGTALLWISTRRGTDVGRARVVPHALALVLTLGGLLRLFLHDPALARSFDHLGLFAPELFPPSGEARMAPASALGFACLGSALFSAQHVTSVRSVMPQLVVVATISYLGFTHYVFGGPPLFPFAVMALPTALGFLTACVGLVLVHPDRGLAALLLRPTAGGAAIRRLLPAVLLIPLLSGWLRLLGQRAGWYDTEAGLALLVLGNMLLLGAVVWRVSLSLDRADRLRRQAEDELRALARRIEAVREEERTRLAREIHDVLAQELTHVKIDLVWLQGRAAPAGDPASAARLAEARSQIDTCIATVQRIATDLRPVVLDSLGLAAAIGWQVGDFSRRTGIACVARVPPDPPVVPRAAATALFRVVQEGLTNIARHSRADTAEVEFAVSAEYWDLRIWDNGIGLTAAQLQDPLSLGLVGIRERVGALGGTVSFAGSPDEGTTVSVRLPRASAP